MSSKKKELARLRSIADAGLEAFAPRTGQKFSYERAVAVVATAMLRTATMQMMTWVMLLLSLMTDQNVLAAQ